MERFVYHLQIDTLKNYCMRNAKFKMEHEIITDMSRMGSTLPIVNKSSEVGLFLRDVYLL